ncbi:MAG: MBL fold metallo-hydrolase [Oscillospiraceae bacterium]|nr:MBL fold metallo-hydrolase [Oscillospiraceae bacterium]
MKLIALKYGTTEITEAMAFQNGNKKKKMPIALLFFLIEADEKKILVDVGCDTMPGFELSEFQKPVEVLEAYGVSRTEITDIIITHAHHDHIDALRYYPQATVYLHRDELKNAEKYLSEHNKICAIDEDKEIIDNVKFKYVGGHSAGSGIVLIKKDGKKYVLCGDECYTIDNLIHKKPTGCSCCLAKSKSFVSEYGKECYIPIVFHDFCLVPDIGYRTLIEL